MTSWKLVLRQGDVMKNCSNRTSQPPSQAPSSYYQLDISYNQEEQSVGLQFLPKDKDKLENTERSDMKSVDLDVSSKLGKEEIPTKSLPVKEDIEEDTHEHQNSLLNGILSSNNGFSDFRMKLEAAPQDPLTVEGVNEVNASVLINKRHKSRKGISSELIPSSPVMVNKKPKSRKEVNLEFLPNFAPAELGGTNSQVYCVLPNQTFSFVRENVLNEVRPATRPKTKHRKKRVPHPSLDTKFAKENAENAQVNDKTAQFTNDVTEKLNVLIGNERGKLKEKSKEKKSKKRANSQSTKIAKEEPAGIQNSYTKENKAFRKSQSVDSVAVKKRADKISAEALQPTGDAPIKIKKPSKRKHNCHAEVLSTCPKLPDINQNEKESKKNKTRNETSFLETQSSPEGKHKKPEDGSKNGEHQPCTTKQEEPETNRKFEYFKIKLRKDKKKDKTETILAKEVTEKCKVEVKNKKYYNLTRSTEMEPTESKNNATAVEEGKSEEPTTTERKKRKKHKHQDQGVLPEDIIQVLPDVIITKTQEECKKSKERKHDQKDLTPEASKKPKRHLKKRRKKTRDTRSSSSLSEILKKIENTSNDAAIAALRQRLHETLLSHANRSSKHRKSRKDDHEIIKISVYELQELLNKAHHRPRSKKPKILNRESEGVVVPSTLRKEVSFSQLNLNPVEAHYSPKFNQCCAFAFDNSPLFDLPTKEIKEDKLERSTRKKVKPNVHNSIVSEAVTKKEKVQYVNGKRYPNRNKRNFAYSENIIERSRKALCNNGCNTLGFTVEGVEPPKKLKLANSSSAPRAKAFPKSLHVTVLSVLEIKPTVHDPFIDHEEFKVTQVQAKGVHGTTEMGSTKRSKSSKLKAPRKSSMRKVMSKSSTTSTETLQRTPASKRNIGVNTHLTITQPSLPRKWKNDVEEQEVLEKSEHFNESRQVSPLGKRERIKNYVDQCEQRKKCLQERRNRSLSGKHTSSKSSTLCKTRSLNRIVLKCSKATSTEMNTSVSSKTKNSEEFGEKRNKPQNGSKHSGFRRNSSGSGALKEKLDAAEAKPRQRSQKEVSSTDAEAPANFSRSSRSTSLPSGTGNSLCSSKEPSPNRKRIRSCSNARAEVENGKHLHKTTEPVKASSSKMEYLSKFGNSCKVSSPLMKSNTALVGSNEEYSATSAETKKNGAKNYIKCSKTETGKCTPNKVLAQNVCSKIDCVMQKDTLKSKRRSSDKDPSSKEVTFKTIRENVKKARTDAASTNGKSSYEEKPLTKLLRDEEALAKSLPDEKPLAKTCSSVVQTMEAKSNATFSQNFIPVKSVDDNSKIFEEAVSKITVFNTYPVRSKNPSQPKSKKNLQTIPSDAQKMSTEEQRSNSEERRKKFVTQANESTNEDAVLENITEETSSQNSTKDSVHQKLTSSVMGKQRAQETESFTCSSEEAVAVVTVPENISSRFQYGFYKYGSFLSEEESEKILKVVAYSTGQPTVKEKREAGSPNLQVESHNYVLGYPHSNQFTSSQGKCGSSAGKPYHNKETEESELHPRKACRSKDETAACFQTGDDTKKLKQDKPRKEPKLILKCPTHGIVCRKSCNGLSLGNHPRRKHRHPEYCRSKCEEQDVENPKDKGCRNESIGACRKTCVELPLKDQENRGKNTAKEEETFSKESTKPKPQSRKKQTEADAEEPTRVRLGLKEQEASMVNKKKPEEHLEHQQQRSLDYHLEDQTNQEESNSDDQSVGNETKSRTSAKSMKQTDIDRMSRTIRKNIIKDLQQSRLWRNKKGFRKILPSDPQRDMKELEDIISKNIANVLRNPQVYTGINTKTFVNSVFLGHGLEKLPKSKLEESPKRKRPTSRDSSLRSNTKESGNFKENKELQKQIVLEETSTVNASRRCCSEKEEAKKQKEEALMEKLVKIISSESQLLLLESRLNKLSKARQKQGDKKLKKRKEAAPATETVLVTQQSSVNPFVAPKPKEALKKKNFLAINFNKARKYKRATKRMNEENEEKPVEKSVQSSDKISEADAGRPKTVSSDDGDQLPEEPAGILRKLMEIQLQESLPVPDRPRLATKPTSIPFYTRTSTGNNLKSFQNSTSTNLSNFQKRKQYGEYVRRRKIAGNRPPQFSLRASVAPVGSKTSVLPCPKDKTPKSSSSSSTPVFDCENLQCYLCTRPNTCVDLVLTKPATVPLVKQSMASSNLSRSEKPYRSATDERAIKSNRNIYQAFTLLTESPNYTDLLKDKFGNAESCLRMFGRDSLLESKASSLGECKDKSDGSSVLEAYEDMDNSTKSSRVSMRQKKRNANLLISTSGQLFSAMEKSKQFQINSGSLKQITKKNSVNADQTNFRQKNLVTKTLEDVPNPLEAIKPVIPLRPNCKGFIKDTSTIFKMDNEIEIESKRNGCREECFKIFAYDNVIELNMDCTIELDSVKSKLITCDAKTACGTTCQSTPLSPAESGYGSIKSSLPKNAEKAFGKKEQIDPVVKCPNLISPQDLISSFPVINHKKVSVGTPSDCPTDSDNASNIPRTISTKPSATCLDGLNFDGTLTPPKSLGYFRYEKPLSYWFRIDYKGNSPRFKDDSGYHTSANPDARSHSESVHPHKNPEVPHAQKAHLPKRETKRNKEQSSNSTSSELPTPSSRLKSLVRTISKPFSVAKRSITTQKSSTSELGFDEEPCGVTKRTFFKRVKLKTDSHKHCESCSRSLDSHQKQLSQCHEYAEKVKLAALGRITHRSKQDFKEIPLSIMIGKSIPGASSQRKQLLDADSEPRLRVLDEGVIQKKTSRNFFKRIKRLSAGNQTVPMANRKCTQEDVECPKEVSSNSRSSLRQKLFGTKLFGPGCKHGSSLLISEDDKAGTFGVDEGSLGKKDTVCQTETSLGEISKMDNNPEDNVEEFYKHLKELYEKLSNSKSESKPSLAIPGLSADNFLDVLCKNDKPMFPEDLCRNSAFQLAPKERVEYNVYCASDQGSTSKPVLDESKSKFSNLTDLACSSKSAECQTVASGNCNVDQTKCVSPECSNSSKKCADQKCRHTGVLTASPKLFSIRQTEGSKTVKPMESTRSGTSKELRTNVSELNQTGALEAKKLKLEDRNQNNCCELDKKCIQLQKYMETLRKTCCEGKCQNLKTLMEKLLDEHLKCNETTEKTMKKVVEDTLSGSSLKTFFKNLDDDLQNIHSLQLLETIKTESEMQEKTLKVEDLTTRSGSSTISATSEKEIQESPLNEYLAKKQIQGTSLKEYPVEKQTQAASFKTDLAEVQTLAPSLLKEDLAEKQTKSVKKRVRKQAFPVLEDSSETSEDKYCTCSNRDCSPARRRSPKAKPASKEPKSIPKDGSTSKKATPEASLQETASLKSRDDAKKSFRKNQTPSASSTSSEALRKLRESLTDKELFEKLLDGYEEEEKIVTRLSSDQEFFQSQLELVRSKESAEALAIIYEEDEEKQIKTGAAAHLNDSEELFRLARRDPGTKKISLRKSSETEKRLDPKKGLMKNMLNLFKPNDSEVKEMLLARDETFRRSSDMPQESLSDEQPAEIDADDDHQVKFSHENDLFKPERSRTASQELDLKRAAVDNVEHQQSSEANLLRPSEIGRCFLRGFRSDNMALNTHTCLLFSDKKVDGRIAKTESFIDFSERETPLEYLLALGFSIDEASNAIKDDDVKNRLFAAITEARVWVNQINTLQGTLLYLVAYKAKPKTMRYFLQLVEAVVNGRIDNAVKLDAFIKVLEKVEDGDLNMLSVVGEEQIQAEETEEKVVRKQLRDLFMNIYKIAEEESELKGKYLSKHEIALLRILTARYRAGLHPHLQLIAKYIGQGLLRTEIQLEAAMIYLSRLDTAEVKLNEFELYCGINCRGGEGKAKPQERFTKV